MSNGVIGKKRKGGYADGTHFKIEGKIPGATYDLDEKNAQREAGIKKCRGCGEFKVLYKAGYCKSCRDKWMSDHGYSNSIGIITKI